MKDLRIGNIVTILGITGTVRGIERLEDETVVGVILRSYQIQHPRNLAHFRVEADHSWQYVPDFTMN